MAMDKVILENSHSLRVLYVEDDEDMRKATGNIFSHFFKSVDCAVDGEDGYAKYVDFLERTKGAYDLVISDIKMPNANGLDMLQKIKAITPEQPAIFITAFSEREFLSQAIELGVEGYLSKPLDVKALKDTLYKVTQKIVDKRLIDFHYSQIEEENLSHIDKIDARQFTAAKNILTDLQDHKEKISIAWCEMEIVRDRLRKHQIDPEYFRKHFGAKVIEYFLGVVDDTSEVGNCPVVFVMLDFFNHKELPLEDVFMICVHFKNSLTSYVFNKYGFNQDLFDDISLIVDKNFEGVIVNYFKMKNRHNAPLRIESKKQKKESTAVVVDDVTNYVDYVLESDVYELQDLEVDIDNLAISITNDANLNSDDIVELGSTIKRYGTILSKYPLFAQLGASITKLGDAFESNSILLDEDKAKMSNITALLEGFVNDLIVWRKEIFEHNVDNPYFLNDSFFSNVDTIIMFIEYDETQESSETVGDDDFFDF
jgi:YesN/AraC family two-component response regulator